MQVSGFVTLPGWRGGCPGLYQPGWLVVFFFWMEVDTSPIVSFGGRGLGIFMLKVPKPEEDSEVQLMVLKAGETAKSMSAFSSWFHWSCSWIWRLKDKDSRYCIQALLETLGLMQKRTYREFLLQDLLEAVIAHGIQWFHYIFQHLLLPQIKSSHTKSIIQCSVCTSHAGLCTIPYACWMKSRSSFGVPSHNLTLVTIFN